MKRLSPSRSRSTLRKKIAIAVAVLTVSVSGSSVDACDYCNQGDGGMVACDACSSRVPGSPNGPLFKTLDAVAGGVEKFLGFDKCGSSACDAGCDGCDAGLMQELMAPPAMSSPQYDYPAMPTVPPETYVDPSVPYTEPMHQTPTPLPPVQPNPNGGGIFDSLDDPFGDDEVRAPRVRSVQPSSFQRSVGTAARPTSRTTRTAASQPTQHAHQAVKRGTHQHHVHHRHVHQHGQKVQLQRAPVPKTKTQNVPSVRRQPMGQRHAWKPLNSYGQSTR